MLQALPPWTTPTPAVVNSVNSGGSNHLAVLREAADTAQGAPLCLQGERAPLAQASGVSSRATLSSAAHRPSRNDGLTPLVRPPTHPSQIAPRARPVTPHDVVLLGLDSHHAAATPVQPSESTESDQAAIHMHQGKLKTKKNNSMLQQPTSTS